MRFHRRFKSQELPQYVFFCTLLQPPFTVACPPIYMWVLLNCFFPLVSTALACALRRRFKRVCVAFSNSKHPSRPQRCPWVVRCHPPSFALILGSSFIRRSEPPLPPPRRSLPAAFRITQHHTGHPLLHSGQHTAGESLLLLHFPSCFSYG